MNAMFGLGRQNIGNKLINLGSDTLKATLLTMASAAGKISLIASSTNASPIVLTTSAAHGINPGDVCVVGGHATNTAANGTWKAPAGTSGSTLSLATLQDGNNSQGNGVGGATGWILNLSQASTLADVSANSLGTDVAIPGVTNTLGVINASSWSWTSLPQTKVWGVAIYDSTASNDLIAWMDGTYQVYVVTQEPAGSSAIAVNRLAAQLPVGGVIEFSDGTSATLSAQANVGDTSLAVNATGAIIHRQATADVATLNCGLPITPNGNLTITPDTGANKLFAI